MFARYNHHLRNRPFVTNAVTTAVLFGVGDLLAQGFFPAETPSDITPSYDYARTGRAMVYGGCIFGVAGDRWYKLLQKVHAPVQLELKRAQTVATTVTRVVVDQTCFSPCLVGVYFYAMLKMEGKSHEELMDKVRNNWWPTLKANWLVWPVVQLANFGIVPVEFQLIVVNVVSIGWNCYISYMNSRG